MHIPPSVDWFESFGTNSQSRLSNGDFARLHFWMDDLVSSQMTLKCVNGMVFEVLDVPRHRLACLKIRQLCVFDLVTVLVDRVALDRRINA